MLIEAVVNNTNSIDYIRYVYFQVIYNIMDSLDAIGIDLQKSTFQVQKYLIIYKSQTPKRTEREFASKTISRCIYLISEYRTLQHEVSLIRFWNF